MRICSPIRASQLRFGTGLAIGMSLGVGMMIGTLVAVNWWGGGLIIPETALHATATHGGETMAAATGPIDDEMEGLYVLDFLTGQLQCAILNHRVGKFNALFSTNVIQDLGIDRTKKNTKYLMVTGLANFPRGASLARPSLSVIYVVDATTGNFAAYLIPWRKQVAITGRPQTGALQLIDVGRARTVAIRD